MAEHIRFDFDRETPEGATVYSAPHELHNEVVITFPPGYWGESPDVERPDWIELDAFHVVAKGFQELPTVGSRVRLRHDVDRYPHFYVRKGATGTVTESTRDQVSVEMDEFVDGAEFWDNNIQWYPINGDNALRDLEVID